MRHFCAVATYIILIFCIETYINADITEHNEYLERYDSPANRIIGPANTHQQELIIQLHAHRTIADLKIQSAPSGIVSIEPVFNTDTPAGQDPLLSRYYLIRFDVQTDIHQFFKTYAEHPIVDKVEFNRLSQFCAETNPNDPRYIEQWNLKTINIPQAWRIESGKPSVVVAVVDSGIKREHPELINQIWQNSDEIPSNGIDDDKNGYVDDIIGWDFSDAPTLQGVGDYVLRDNNPDDETGHGTHVSGIIAAEANNGIGIAGVAWNCLLMPLRAGLRLAGGGAFLQNDDVAAAIVYAADNGADVINLSLGDTVNAFVIQDAVQYAYNKGCIIVAAAGNAVQPGAYFPAALNTVISVASLDSNLHLGNSNFGASIDIAAPGEDILSTDITQSMLGYAIRSGTSMATAHVSGVAALLISANPSCNNTEIKDWLIQTARQLSITDLVGAGLVDAYAVLTEQTHLTAHITATDISLDSQGGNQEKVEIFGTAAGNGFSHFWLDYGISETPDLWYPIGIVETEVKYNTLLQEWNTSELDEGIYTIRLNVKAENGDTNRDKVVVVLRQTMPEVSKHESSIWISGNSYESTIIWHTDVLTTGIVEVFSQDIDKPIRIARSDSVNLQHIVYLSETGLPAGEYLYQLKSHNLTGTTRIDNSESRLYPIAVRQDQINQIHLQESAVARQGYHVIATNLDLNNNGKRELIGVTSEGPLMSFSQIFEFTENGDIANVASINQNISRIWDIADTDGDNLYELLCSASTGSKTITFLLEQPSIGEYPSDKIWESEENWGGIIADLDSDGLPEIYSRHNSTDAISVYESVADSTFTEVTKLENPTQGMNAIGTKFATGDYDGDGHNEIVAGDNDGHVFIYENIGDNRYRHTWSDVMIDSIPLLFAAGDMDGDGISEFAIGAKAWTVGIDLPRQHWLFAAYTSSDDDVYKKVWHQRIRELQDGESGMRIADANSDGVNEVCIVVPPNSYLIQYDGFSYKPIWHHTATSTFNPIVADIDSDGINELLFNADKVLTAYDRNMSINSTQSTTTVPVTQTPQPEIVSAQYSAPQQLLVVFNAPMNKSAGYTSRYRLYRYAPETENMNKNRASVHFTPQSAILDRSLKRVVLTFSDDVFSSENTYQLETFQLSDLNGVELSEDTRTIMVEYSSATSSNIKVYPNPARGNQVVFDRLPNGSKVRIFNVSGGLIESLNPENDLHVGGRCRKIWSLNGVSSGIYIYVIESDKENLIGKISVIK